MPRTCTARSVLLVVTGLLTGLIWHWVDSSPLVWSGLLWIGVLTAFSLQSKAPWQRTLLLSAAAVVASLVLVETTLWATHANALRQTRQKAGYYLIKHDVLNTWQSLFIEDGPLGLHPPPGTSIEDAAKVG